MAALRQTLEVSEANAEWFICTFECEAALAALLMCIMC